MTLLSICIPSFNRADQVTALAATILEVEGDFELCIHDDGSSDDTFNRLSAISDPRLRIESSENGGRGQALEAAIRMSKGQFVMIFDDDDFLFPDGLRRVLADCSVPLPSGCAGRIYQLEDENGQRVGSDFPVARSNLVALRADHGVKGDKKEVVLRRALNETLAVPGKPRRVPTSLYWTRLALNADVLCVNVSIGRKTYLVGGMSDRIKALKTASPHPLYLLARSRIHAFLRRRYQSPRYLLRCVAAYLLYGARVILRSKNEQAP